MKIKIKNKENNKVNTDNEEISITNQSSELNDSYHRFKNIYQRQIKKKNLTDGKSNKSSIFEKENPEI